MIQNKTIQNASWIIGIKIAQAVLKLIISMLTARLMGPSNFGLINYATSIVNFVIPIMELGLTSILVHELILDENCEGEILGTTMISCLLSSVFCIFGVFAFTSAANHNETETIIVCVLYSLALIGRAFETISAWFQAHLMSKYTSVACFFAYIITSAYKIYLLLTHKSIYWFAISNSVESILTAAAVIFLYKKLGKQPFQYSKKRFSELFRKSKYYILSGMMIAVFSQTDRVMLKLMMGNDATGYYSAAVTAAGMTAFVFGAIIDSSSPTIFSSKKISQELFYRNMRYLYSVVIFGALFQSVIMALFSKVIIMIIFGAEFYESVGALRIVVWYTTFSYIGSVRNRWLLAEEKQNLIWKIDVSGALANVGLNFVLIPHYGIMGAAAASLATQVFTNFILGWIMKDIRPNNKLMIQSLNPRVLIQLLRDIR